MPITAHFNFASDRPWANGSGCLTCGSNVSDLGREAGVQCVDLGVDDSVLGHFGLCYDCALQVALAIGCVSKAAALETLESARALADEATQEREDVLAAAAQARLDRDTVERLLGSVYSPEEAAAL